MIGGFWITAGWICSFWSFWKSKPCNKTIKTHQHFTHLLKGIKNKQ
jgi:hypothetical protein